MYLNPLFLLSTGNKGVRGEKRSKVGDLRFKWERGRREQGKRETYAQRECLRPGDTDPELTRNQFLAAEADREGKALIWNDQSSTFLFCAFFLP